MPKRTSVPKPVVSTAERCQELELGTFPDEDQRRVQDRHELSAATDQQHQQSAATATTPRGPASPSTTAAASTSKHYAGR